MGATTDMYMTPLRRVAIPRPGRIAHRGKGPLQWAQRMFGKSARTGKRLVVVDEAGAVRAHFEGSKRFAFYSQAQSRRLIGIYSVTAAVDDLADDARHLFPVGL